MDRWAEDNYLLDRWVDAVLDPCNASAPVRRRPRRPSRQEAFDRAQRLQLERAVRSPVTPGSLRVTIAELLTR